VVAAIILIAVTVAVSIAVAAWMGALTFTFMKTEELRITSHEWEALDPPTKITLSVVNTGTAKLTLDYYEVSGTKTDIDPDETLDPGETYDLDLLGTFTAGVKYEFAIVTKTGGRYVYMATAPS